MKSYKGYMIGATVMELATHRIYKILNIANMKHTDLDGNIRPVYHFQLKDDGLGSFYIPYDNLAKGYIVYNDIAQELYGSEVKLARDRLKIVNLGRYYSNRSIITLIDELNNTHWK